MRRAKAISLVLSLAGLLGLLGGCGSSHPTSPHFFEASERRAVRALRGPTRPVPPALQRHLQQARNPEIRTLRLDTARYVPIDTGFWVVNGPGRTCIVQTHGGAVGCESRQTLLSEGVALGVVTLGPPPGHAPREFLVAGIVPNKVGAVELKVGDETRTVRVHDNAYSLRAPAPIVVEHLLP
jgi:hypothetical protein